MSNAQQLVSTHPLQSVWRVFCQFMVKVFYRQYEVTGISNLPASGPVLLCANHANALVDAVVIQSIIDRTVHPIARSGLFKNPLLKPILLFIQAVPVFRRQDHSLDKSEGNTQNAAQGNHEMFSRCYEMLRENECLLIFPEGQSHSDPRLREFKSGAARLVLGALQNNINPVVVPVGLNFSDKGKFRSRVLVKISPPVELDEYTNDVFSDDAEAVPDKEHVRKLTNSIQHALSVVTINEASIDDIDFLQRVERFFAARHGKYRNRSLDLRFQAFKKLSQAQDHLRETCPEKIAHVKRQLQQYERMCKRWSIHDYHLTINYRPALITRFILRSLFAIFIILPVAAFGILNSLIPFLMTRHLARLISKGKDQYDTAKMVLGLFFFWIFWGAQTAVLYSYTDFESSLIYAISLPPSAAAALFFRKERERIWDNIRVFFVFVRKKKLKLYLERKRKHIERELAYLVRAAKQKLKTELQ